MGVAVPLFSELCKEAEQPEDLQPVELGYVPPSCDQDMALISFIFCWSVIYWRR